MVADKAKQTLAKEESAPIVNEPKAPAPQEIAKPVEEARSRPCAGNS